MTYKIVLPTYEEAHKAVIGKESTSLDIFLYNYEPSGESDARIFRTRLENALQYAIEEHDTFRLTTDAPEMTVGDSGSISEDDTNDACPMCFGNGRIKENYNSRRCPFCDGTGKKSTTKPDDFTPSPTPSFR